MVKSGPVHPLFMAFIIQKYFKQYEKVYGNTLENIIFGNMRSKKKENAGSCAHPSFELFKFWKLGIMKFWNYETLRSWKVEDEDWQMMTVGLIKSGKAWIWVSYLSKNMKLKFGKSYKLCDFQGRESFNIN